MCVLHYLHCFLVTGVPTFYRTVPVLLTYCSRFCLEDHLSLGYFIIKDMSLKFTVTSNFLGWVFHPGSVLFLSMFCNDAHASSCFRLEKLFCYSVGAETLYGCFTMLTVFCYVTMKSVFHIVFFLLVVIYLMFLFLKRSFLNYIFFSFAQVLDAVVSLSVTLCSFMIISILAWFLKSSLYCLVYHIDSLLHFTSHNKYLNYEYSIVTPVLIFYSLKWI
jgi:hypothetical protein